MKDFLLGVLKAAFYGVIGYYGTIYCIGKIDTPIVSEPQEAVEVVKKEAPKQNYAPASYGGFNNLKSNSRNIGTTKMADSRTYILVLYMSQPSHPLYQYEKSMLRNSLNSATNWLRKEASYYGKDLYFVMTHVGFKEGTEIVIDDRYNLDEMPVRKIVEAYYGRNYRDIVKQKAQEHNCDNYMVMICNNGYRCSLAYKDDEKLHRRNGFDYFEGCIINVNGAGNLSSIVAHEILHTFGAWDLYKDELYVGEGAQYKSRLYNSIMNDTYQSLSEAEIDPVTAYLIGFTDYKDDWFPVLAKNVNF